VENEKPLLFTIGHSVHSLEHFVNILKLNDIKAIADVRALPYSKFTPQFNREGLQEFLKGEDIDYIFSGKELGARWKNPECYSSNKVIFSKVANMKPFQEGLLQLAEVASRMRTAIMCAEKDPLACHRTLLVARYGKKHFSDIRHILEDGTVESGRHADQRLLAAYHLDAEDLFSSGEERLNIAYTKRAEKIAYEEEQDDTLGRLSVNSHERIDVQAPEERNIGEP